MSSGRHVRSASIFGYPSLCPTDAYGPALLASLAAHMRLLASYLLKQGLWLSSTAACEARCDVLHASARGAAVRAQLVAGSVLYVRLTTRRHPLALPRLSTITTARRCGSRQPAFTLALTNATLASKGLCWLGIARSIVRTSHVCPRHSVGGVPLQSSLRSLKPLRGQLMSGNEAAACETERIGIKRADKFCVTEPS